MIPVIMSEPKRFAKDGHEGISASLTISNNREEIWYKSSRGTLAYGLEGFLPAILAPAMKTGSDLGIPGPISQRLFNAIPTIQDIYQKWYSGFRRICIKSDGIAINRPNAALGVGCFFSAGVDSFYTLLKHKDEITDLIFIHGFDISLGSRWLRDVMSDIVGKIGVEFNKSVIEIETNQREFGDKYVAWGEYYGAMLASIALLLSGRLKKVYIPASHSYRNLFPRASHLILDPLWSTEELEIVHDGCEALRAEKIAVISSCESAMRSLRVCWNDRSGTYNCGRCEKCLRTMVGLLAVGALERCRTFEGGLDLALVARVRVDERVARTYTKMNLHAIERLGGHPDLERALRNSLSGIYYRGVAGWPGRLWQQLLKRMPVGSVHQAHNGSAMK